MVSAPRSQAPRALVLAVLILGLLGCAGGPEETAPPSAPPGVPTAEEPAAPAEPAPEAVVRVVDGDSSKPVAGATVAVADERARTGRDGTASLAEPEWRNAKVRLSAPGYRARTVGIALREDRPHTVRLWQPGLQWTMYGANPARTQVHPKISLRPPFRPLWRRSLHGMLEFPAVVWEGVAYVNNMDGWLHALSMKNGHVLWRKRIGTLVASSPAIDPSRGVLVTATMLPGDVKVIDLDTGRVRWRFPTGARSEPSPVIRDGVAYVGAENGNVWALDLDRRRPRWTFRGGVKITSSPALAGRRLYFGDYAGRVFALNARTGRPLWTGSAGSRVYGTVAVSGGRVFAPSVFSGLSALSTRSGRLLWRIPAGAYLYSSPAVYRGRIYFGTYAGRVYAASARSGRILWSRPTGGRVSGAVQVVAGVVYAATLERRTTAWHWRTGRTLWTFPQGRYVPVSGSGARLLMHGGRKIWAVVPKKRRR